MEEAWSQGRQGPRSDARGRCEAWDKALGLCGTQGPAHGGGRGPPAARRGVGHSAPSHPEVRQSPSLARGGYRMKENAIVSVTPKTQRLG